MGGRRTTRRWPRWKESSGGFEFCRGDKGGYVTFDEAHGRGHRRRRSFVLPSTLQMCSPDRWSGGKGAASASGSPDRPGPGAGALLPRRHREWYSLHRASAHPARRIGGDRQRHRAGGAGAVQPEARRRGRRRHPGRCSPGDPLHHPHSRTSRPSTRCTPGTSAGRIRRERASWWRVWWFRAPGSRCSHTPRCRSSAHCGSALRRDGGRGAVCADRETGTVSSPQRGRLSMQRRRFFVKAGGALVAAGAASVVNAPNVIAQPRIQWRMPTMWPPALDVLQGNAQKFAKIVEELTGGRFKIQVFAGGELMPATGVFDACIQGTVEAFNGAAYYWAGKENGAPVVHVRAVRAQHAGVHGVVPARRRPQALGRGLRALRRGAAARPVHQSPDGRMVPEEDQHRRRPEGPQDPHPGPGRQGVREGGRRRGAPAAGRDLHGARARHPRRRRVHRAARRPQARLPERGPLLLLPGLAGGHVDRRVQLQQEGVRRPVRRVPPRARLCSRGDPRQLRCGVLRQERRPRSSASTRSSRPKWS